MFISKRLTFSSLKKFLWKIFFRPKCYFFFLFRPENHPRMSGLNHLPLSGELSSSSGPMTSSISVRRELVSLSWKGWFSLTSAARCASSTSQVREIPVFPLVVMPAGTDTKETCSGRISPSGLGSETGSGLIPDSSSSGLDSGTGPGLIPGSSPSDLDSGTGSGLIPDSPPAWIQEQARG